MPDARAAYLDGACGTDSVLRGRIEALLSAAENAGDFLERPPTGLSGEDGSTPVPGEVSEKTGDRIGRYKLLERVVISHSLSWVERLALVLALERFQH